MNFTPIPLSIIYLHYLALTTSLVLDKVDITVPLLSPNILQMGLKENYSEHWCGRQKTGLPRVPCSKPRNRE